MTQEPLPACKDETTNVGTPQVGGAGATRAGGVAHGSAGGPVLEAECVASGPSSLEAFFATPSLAEAEHMLRELDWGQHFVGVVMSAAVGEQRMYVYSLKEAVQYLYGGTAGLGFASGSKGSVCWYDTEAFIAWTRDMVGDQALAAALADAYEASASHHEAVRNMGVIVCRAWWTLRTPPNGRRPNRAGRAHERRCPRRWLPGSEKRRTSTVRRGLSGLGGVSACTPVGRFGLP